MLKSIHVPLFAFVIAIHVAVAFQADFPRGFYDELVYLGFARLFAGRAEMPDLAEGGLGHFGYAVFLTPLYAIFDDFPAQYRAVVCLNALFLSSLYVTTCFLVRRLFSLSRTGAALIATVVAFYPTYLLFAGFAIADALFAPWYMLVLVLLYRYVSRPSTASAVMLSVAVGISYAIHARSLAIMVCLWALALGLGWKKLANLPQMAALLLIPLAFWIGVGEANDALAAVAGVSHPDGGGRAASVLAEHPSAVVAGAAGQLFYLSAASLHLYPLGLSALIAIAMGWPRLPFQSYPARLTALFSLGSHAGVLAGSVLFLLPEWLHGQPTKVLSSRYPEGTLSIILAAGAALIWLAGRDPNWRRLMWLGLLAGALLTGYAGLFVAPYMTPEDLSSGFRFETISLIPIVLVLEPATWGKIAAVSLAATIAICLLALSNRQAALTLTATFFLAMAWLVQDHFSSLQSLVAAGIDDRVVAMGAQLPEGSRVAYDLAVWHPFTYGYYQLYLPGKEFVPFDSRTGQSPPAAAMLIAGSDPRLVGNDYRLTDCKSSFGIDYCIWTPSSGGGFP